MCFFFKLFVCESCGFIVSAVLGNVVVLTIDHYIMTNHISINFQCGVFLDLFGVFKHMVMK